MIESERREDVLADAVGVGPAQHLLDDQPEQEVVRVAVLEILAGLEPERLPPEQLENPFGREVLARETATLERIVAYARLQEIV